MTQDESIVALAKKAGLEVRWTDARGSPQTVGIETLRAVLAALDLPTGSRQETNDSLARLRRERAHGPPLIVTRSGDSVFLDGGKLAELEAESGERATVRLSEADGRVSFRAPRSTGYYRIRSGAGEMALAVAPARALVPSDVTRGKLAGISVQIYSLRGGTSGGFGDFAALGAFARAAGLAGFDAIMASPVHALFGAEPARFSPYSPSTRIFFNPMFADATLVGGAKLAPPPRNESSLINWKTAGKKKHRALRQAFAHFRRAGDLRRFEAFCREGGKRLLAHALFEALDAQFRRQGVHGFHRWPAGFDSPAAAKVSPFAKSARTEIEYQLFLQWLAAQSAEAAQKKARATMEIGIIADLAVGMDPEGSHAWSAPQELLRGLHVGAPPDIFNRQGQDWGLTALSPRALRAFAYAPFIATLRAAMRYAGGVRIDHALGLRRLWVVPAGAAPSEGAYLRLPQDEMLRLIALESHRNRALVIGEDLGTVPEGFRADLAHAGVLGTQVLWFERNGEAFAKPAGWRREAIATTTTHDLPTVAGWWTERDIAWRKRLGHLRDHEEREQSARAQDRARLWTALREAHCAAGDLPVLENYKPAVEAALAYVGRTRSTIAFAPVEDLLADPEQPNLPGTIDEHPNWRRRLKNRDVFRDQAAGKRIRTFLAARGKS
ncbi:MAG TPA: 4-alpha-glucanotransferase [Rhizomicrobium sp.]|jgi:4-alpha-glucanotransferase|nr:4-alpha-glucanotransferase [Rhizomicrobium sp.]